MTRARKDERKPAEQARKLKLAKETVKDLDPKAGARVIRGGAKSNSDGPSC
jgi:hypothetical protein